jgi:N-acyl-D-aspartate/D-glutamate deacylase
MRRAGAEHVDCDALMAGPGHGARRHAQAAAAWDWRTFGEWLDRLDGRLASAASSQALDHKAVVMGDDATTATATPDQIAEMVRLLHESLDAGALGFSSSLGEAHTDGDGRPVPSRAAGFEEFLALAGAVRDHAGTTLEFIAAMGEIPSDRAELMAEKSLAADRPLNWNLLGRLSPTDV